MNHWQHYGHNICNTDTCSLPSGSNDWKTLLACSDGDSGPTRDISYREGEAERRKRKERRIRCIKT